MKTSEHETLGILHDLGLSPRPLGIAVLRDGKTIAFIELDEFKRTYDRLLEMQRKRKETTDVQDLFERCAEICDEIEAKQQRDHGAANTGGAAECAAALRRNNG